MDALCDASESPLFPRILIVHPASVEAASPFFASRAPGMPTISDTEHTLYRGFGLGKGSFGELFGLRPIIRALQATLRGHFIGKPAGDPFLMPGMFLVEGQRVLAEHRSRHAGDHPYLEAFVSVVEAQAHTV